MVKTMKFTTSYQFLVLVSAAAPSATAAADRSSRFLRASGGKDQGSGGRNRSSLRSLEHGDNLFAGAIGEDPVTSGDRGDDAGAVGGAGVSLGGPVLLQIGEHVNISITASDLQGSTDGTSGSFTLFHNTASFLNVHFNTFDLPEGCHVTTTNEDGREEYSLTRQGLFGLGTFWGHHVNGNTIVITLKCDDIADMAQATFSIDEYVAGYPEPDTSTNSICNTDDKRNAFCYIDSYPVKYDKSRAVARLHLNGGSSACTGWLVGRDLLMTNYHCISSVADVQAAEFEFMGEEDHCSSTQDGSWFSSPSDFIFDGNELVASNGPSDYALVRLTGFPGDAYGFFELDNRDPIVGEEIYIPQHPGGRPKEIGIVDTNEASGKCAVKRVQPGGCTGSGNGVTYSCDTEGGSSGSPVIAASNDKVIAIHNCGGACNGNLGVPVSDFYSQIAAFLGPAATPPPTSGSTPSPSSEPSISLTSEPTPFSTDANTSEPTPSPTEASTSEPPSAPPTTDVTSAGPTFFACSQFNEANGMACTRAYGGNHCQWLGSCHNCGCVPVRQED